MLPQDAQRTEQPSQPRIHSNRRNWHRLHIVQLGCQGRAWVRVVVKSSDQGVSTSASLARQDGHERVQLRLEPHVQQPVSLIQYQHLRAGAVADALSGSQGRPLSAAHLLEEPLRQRSIANNATAGSSSLTLTGNTS